MSQNRTILVIDYDPRSIQGMVDPLTRAGYKVEVRNDGESGLKAFYELGPALVLIEPMIPKKHGFQVCREIKNSERGRDVPVVIATSFYRGRKHHLDARKNFGCDDYLEKPVSESRLLERCGALLAVPVAVEPAGGGGGVVSAPSPEEPAERHAVLDQFLDGGSDGPEGATDLPPTPIHEIDYPLDGPTPVAIEIPEPQTTAMPGRLEIAAEETRSPVALPREALPARVEPAPPVAEAATTRRSRLPLWLALAAVVCVLSGLAILWALRATSSPVSPRTPRAESGSRGSGVVP
jgi:CheY-like chemotaxis protein